MFRESPDGCGGSYATFAGTLFWVAVAGAVLLALAGRVFGDFDAVIVQTNCDVKRIGDDRGGLRSWEDETRSDTK